MFALHVLFMHILLQWAASYTLAIEIHPPNSQTNITCNLENIVLYNPTTPTNKTTPFSKAYHANYIYSCTHHKRS